MTETIVSPSILSGDFANMGKSVEDVKTWGGDWVHCDVMDGVYVTNLTFGMPMVQALKKRTDLPLDVHLMIDKPERYVKRFVEAGADLVTFHPEASAEPIETLRIIKESGAKCGIAFNPNVPVEEYGYLIDYCDIVVIMTVFAGYGGQKLIPECLEKVGKVKQIAERLGKEIYIEVDGGVTEENSADVRNAGANVLVAGSAVFKSSDPTRTIKILKGVTK